MLHPEQLKGQLQFHDISFAYPTRKDAPIFHNLSLQVPAGTIMAVVGSSGSGKSTLVSLLLRLYDPDAGENEILTLIDGCCITSDSQSVLIFPFLGFISVDGHDIRDLNPYWLRSQIGTVSQVNEMILFNVAVLCCATHST